MTEEEWIDKVTLKKRWEIKEDKLLEMVFERIITPYCKHTDGNFYQLPRKLEKTSYRTQWETQRWMDVPVTKRHIEYVNLSKEQIENALQTTFKWFRSIDIDDVEYEGKIKLPEKQEEEPPRPQLDPKADPVNYASVRHKEGADDAIIAVEMETAGVNQLYIGQTLCTKKFQDADKGVPGDKVIQRMKMRAKRLIEQGRKLMKQNK